MYLSVDKSVYLSQLAASYALTVLPPSSSFPSFLVMEMNASSSNSFAKVAKTSIFPIADQLPEKVSLLNLQHDLLLNIDYVFNTNPSPSQISASLKSNRLLLT
jgi:hypothetical protein